MQLLRAARTLTRRPQLPALRRHIESKAAADVNTFEQFAHTFQATVEGLTNSHERSLNAQRKDLTDQINALQQQLRRAEVALNQSVMTNTHIQEDLRRKLEISRNNLHLRSAIEIIATSLERHKGLKRRNPAQGAGVQPVINAVAAGGFNDPTVIFQDSQKAVVGALTAKGGIKPKEISRALASLYGELSKHRHTGVSQALTLREGEQTLSEAIGAMSIVLFARRLYASDFDVVYYDSDGNIQVTLSKL
ncbi:hypothetical protein FB451DRAFT_1564292 [Mycena latifolia]|nr:hypothetical protein FB451DRAFT_1564292 [Mycena latifolia]